MTEEATERRQAAKKIAAVTTVRWLCGCKYCNLKGSAVAPRLGFRPRTEVQSSAVVAFRRQRLLLYFWRPYIV